MKTKDRFGRNQIGESIQLNRSIITHTYWPGLGPITQVSLSVQRFERCEVDQIRDFACVPLERVVYDPLEGGTDEIHR